MSRNRDALRTEEAEWRLQMMREEGAMAALSCEQRAAERQGLEVHMNSIIQQRTAWNEQQLEEAVARQRASLESAARTEAEESSRQHLALQEHFSDMYNQQGAKVQALETC